MGVTEKRCLSHPEISEYCFKKRSMKRSINVWLLQWWRSWDLVLSRDRSLGLISVSGLEILVSDFCSKGLGLAHSNLPRPPRPQYSDLKKKIIEIAFLKQQNNDPPRSFLVLQLWSTKSGIIYLNTLCRFPALRSCMGSLVTSIVMTRRPVQVYCVLCVLVKKWGLGLSLDLGFLKSRSRRGGLDLWGPGLGLGWSGLGLGLGLWGRDSITGLLQVWGLSDNSLTPCIHTYFTNFLGIMSIIQFCFPLFMYSMRHFLK